MMDETNQFASLYDSLVEKFGITDDDAEDIVDTAKNIYMSLRKDYGIEKYTPYEISWIKRACYEICDRMEKGMLSGVVEYSENGYSYTVDGSIISSGLANEILPKVGVIRYDS